MDAGESLSDPALLTQQDRRLLPPPDNAPNTQQDAAALQASTDFRWNEIGVQGMFVEVALNKADMDPEKHTFKASQYNAMAANVTTKTGFKVTGAQLTSKWEKMVALWKDWCYHTHPQHGLSGWAWTNGVPTAPNEIIADAHFKSLDGKERCAKFRTQPPPYKDELEQLVASSDATGFMAGGLDMYEADPAAGENEEDLPSDESSRTSSQSPAPRDLSTPRSTSTPTPSSSRSPSVTSSRGGYRQNLAGRKRSASSSSSEASDAKRPRRSRAANLYQQALMNHSKYMLETVILVNKTPMQLVQEKFRDLASLKRLSAEKRHRVIKKITNKMIGKPELIGVLLAHEGVELTMWINDLYGRDIIQRPSMEDDSEGESDYSAASQERDLDWRGSDNEDVDT
jgi:hypothetical protein